VRFIIDERFVYDLKDPDEGSGKTQRHIVDAETAHAALSVHAITTDARLLGITERQDGTLGGTAWRGERLFRIHIRPADDGNAPTETTQ
jgi:hypothetical protein